MINEEQRRNQDIRECYLKGKSDSRRHTDIERQIRLLHERQFYVYQGADISRIEKLLWSTKERDFDALDKVYSYLLEIFNPEHGISPEKFNVDKLIEKIKEILLGSDEKRDKYPGSPLFRRLNDENILVNKGHEVDPFSHTLNVLHYLDASLSNLSPHEKVLLLLGAVGHDIGKLCIAQNDFYHDHPEISYLIMRDWINNRGVNLNVYQSNWDGEDLVLDLIRYHHGLETVDKGLISQEEFSEMVNSQQLIKLLAIFSFADASSIGPAYDKYATDNMEEALGMLEKLQPFANVMKTAEEIVTNFISFMRWQVGLLSIETIVSSYEKVISGVQRLVDSSELALRLQNDLDQMLAENEA